MASSHNEHGTWQGSPASPILLTSAACCVFHSQSSVLPTMSVHTNVTGCFICGGMILFLWARITSTACLPLRRSHRYTPNTASAPVTSTTPIGTTSLSRTLYKSTLWMAARQQAVHARESRRICMHAVWKAVRASMARRSAVLWCRTFCNASPFLNKQSQNSLANVGLDAVVACYTLQLTCTGGSCWHSMCVTVPLSTSSTALCPGKHMHSSYW